MSSKEDLLAIRKHADKMSTLLSLVKKTQQPMRQIMKANENFMALQNAMQKTWGPILDNISKLERIAESQNTFFKKLSISFEKMASNIDGLTLSEEDRFNLKESYITWGKLGWTPFLNKKQICFLVPPKNNVDGDNKLKEYCSSSSVKELFNILNNQIGNLSGLQSAIFCYQQGEYKACTLLLFSLIEERLLKRQTNTAKVGRGAIELLESDYKDMEADELFSHLLRHACLFSCLYVMFARANDFKDSMMVINRNYVCHGMEDREITKKDCIQLFLALGNLDNLMKEFPHEIPESES